MLKFALVIAAFGLHLYAFLDVWRSPVAEVRLLPKWLWIAAVLLPLLGPLGWILAGRPITDRGEGGLPGRGDSPVAPDDNPDFLKRLDEQSWAARMEQLRRQRDARGDDPDGRDSPKT